MIIDLGGKLIIKVVTIFGFEKKKKKFAVESNFCIVSCKSLVFGREVWLKWQKELEQLMIAIFSSFRNGNKLLMDEIMFSLQPLTDSGGSERHNSKPILLPF